MAEMKNPYGRIVRDEMLKKHMSTDTMAVRCMMSPEALKEVEYGNRWFSEAELRLASSALNLSRDGLLRGERDDRTTTEALRDLLTEFYKDIRELTHLQENILKKITEISNWQRFTVDQIRKGKSDPKLYEPVQYAIFDNDRGDYIRDESGEIVFFQSASEAFEKAEEMESAVKSMNTVSAEREKEMERIKETGREEHVEPSANTPLTGEYHKEDHAPLTEMNSPYDPEDEEELEQRMSVPKL